MVRKKLTFTPSPNGKNSKGETYWRVNKGKKLNGEPDYEPFGTDYQAALAFCENLELKARIGGQLGVDHIKNQSAADVQWAFNKLAEIGIPLKDCVESYLKQNFPESGATSVDRAARALLKKHAPPYLKLVTFKRYEEQLNKFAAHFDGRDLHTITTEDLEAYFESKKSWGLRTATPNKKLFNTFFNWWQTHGYLSRDVAHAASRLMTARNKNLGPRKPKLAKPNEAADMLNWHCAQAKERERSKAGKKTAESIYGVVFQLVLILFGGARRAEAACLCWDHVKWKKGHIVVPPDISKISSKDRFIPLEGNLAEWLKFLKHKGAECAVEKNVEVRSDCPPPMRRLEYRQKKYRKSFEERGAPVPDIVKTDLQERDGQESGRKSENLGIMRHSFVSYHLELFHDPVRTTKQSGHSIRTAESTYNEAVEDSEDAAHWFAITPPELVSAKEILNQGIETVEQAAEIERKIEFLETLKPTEELRGQAAALFKSLRLWLNKNGDNVHALAKYRQWHEDHGGVQVRNEEGTIMAKLTKFPSAGAKKKPKRSKPN